MFGLICQLRAEFLTKITLEEVSVASNTDDGERNGNGMTWRKVGRRWNEVGEGRKQW